tara:strand:- start:78 stop:488 length:411 start_codon:yes stop_codon:yes gene_type:complete
MDDQKLIESRKSLEKDMESLKKDLQTINEVFEHKYGNTARDKLREAGKDFGSTSFMIANNIKLNATFRKKVEWDQAGLMTTLDTEMDADDARHYGKISVTIEERKYSTAPPTIKAILEPHRTVDLAGVSFKLEEVE